MKVVFDSNIYISALVLPGGAADRAIRAVSDAGVEVFISRPILEEVLGVMSRKFARARRASRSSRFGNSSIGMAAGATFINRARPIV